MKLDLRAWLLASLAPLLLTPLGACGESPNQILAGETSTIPEGAPPATPAVDAGLSSSPSPPSGGGAAQPDGGAPLSDSGSTTTDASAPTRKRGVAYGSNTEADLAALSAGIGWWYNWSPSPDGTLPAGYASQGVEFVPMIWGGTFDVTKLATQVPVGAKYLLTFNEPNFGAQSNLTPAQAAALWPQIQTFADAHGLAIVSPALNYCGGNCNETNPFTWLDAFFAACTGCRVDYVAAHWYACSKSALAGYLAEYETKYDKPIWLTEFSCLDGSLAATPANEAQYLSDAVALLESDPKVFRYSWFTGRSKSTPAIDLLDVDAGTLTPLGQSYVTLP